MKTLVAQFSVNSGVNNLYLIFYICLIAWMSCSGRDSGSLRDTSINIPATADGGGSNSSKGKLWKYELQKFANETGMNIEVAHFPPGTSKWNKIEHRLFSYISKNWRGKPLVSYQIIVNYIAGTNTTKGLKVACEIDDKEYVTGIEISDEQFAALNMYPNKFHGEWNYCICPE